jgi:hypothetical protein
MIEISLHKPMTPSRLLRLVVDAVDTHFDVKKFQFELDSFGDLGGDFAEEWSCFGCFATVGICQMYGLTYPELIAKISPELRKYPGSMEFWPSTILSITTDARPYDFFALRKLELAIDEIRDGNFIDIFNWCQMNGQWPLSKARVEVMVQAVLAIGLDLDALQLSSRLSQEEWRKNRDAFLEVAETLNEIEQWVD